MESRCQNLIDYASYLKRAIDDKTLEQNVTINDLLVYIRALPLPRSAVPSEHRSMLNAISVKLWNACNNIQKDRGAEKIEKIVAATRTFAYLLLSSLVRAKVDIQESDSSYLSAAFWTLKQCIHAAEYEAAGRVLKAMACVYPTLTAQGTDEAVHSFALEYNSLRLTYEWRRSREDLAEYQWTVLESLLNKANNFQHATVVLDLLHEMGTTAIDKREYQVALQWLERGRMLLEDQRWVDDFKATDTRLNILHTYTRALRDSNVPENYANARDMLRLLEDEYGSRLAVVVLQLEFFACEPGTDASGLSETLTKMITSMHLLDSNHHIVIGYLWSLYRRSQLGAVELSINYIRTRLRPEQRSDLAHDALTQCLYMLLGSGTTDQANLPANLRYWLDSLLQSWGGPLPPACAQAAHAMLQKILKQPTVQRSPSLGIGWCRVAQHPLLHSAGRDSTSVFEYTIIQRHLDNGDVTAAQSLLDVVPTASRSDHIRAYLAYCIAMRDKNTCNAQVALHNMATACTTNSDSLDWALRHSLKEASEHGNRMDCVHVLRAFVNASEGSCNLNMPRIVIAKHAIECLLCAASSTDDDQEVAEHALVFTKFASIVVQDLTGAGQIHLSPHIHDCRSITSATLQLAMAKCRSFEPRVLVDILTHLMHMNESLKRFDLGLRPEESLQSGVLNMISCAELARASFTSVPVQGALPKALFNIKTKSSAIEIRSRLYQQVSDEYGRILVASRACHKGWPGAASKDVSAELENVIPLAFEALLVTTSQSYHDDGHSKYELRILYTFLNDLDIQEVHAVSYALLVDLVLTFAMGSDTSPFGNLRIPAISAAQLIGRIVAKMRRLEVYDVDQASRWIRCIAQLLVESIEHMLQRTGSVASPPLVHALQILQTVVDQTLALARGCHNADQRVLNLNGETRNLGHDKNEYPTEEIEWLAVRVFNMAVDFHAANLVQLAEAWVQKGIDIVSLLTDRKDAEVSLKSAMLATLQQMGIKCEM